MHALNDFTRSLIAKSSGGKIVEYFYAQYVGLIQLHTLARFMKLLPIKVHDTF